MAEETLGESIPPNTAHAVSVSLPTWRSCVGYEEGEAWVLNKMHLGYPRFFIAREVTTLSSKIVSSYGHAGEAAILLPSRAVASRCLKWLQKNVTGLKATDARILEFGSPHNDNFPEIKNLRLHLFAVLYPEEQKKIAKAFWQHSGEGISSRQAEFCLKALDEGHLTCLEIHNQPHPVGQTMTSFHKGPRRYQRISSPDVANFSGNAAPDPKEFTTFIEERFGRNLNMTLASTAKVAIRRRIAGSIVSELEPHTALSLPPSTSTTRLADLTEDDVYLYPTGMSSIFNAHRLLLSNSPTIPPPQSVCFGFPYTDTLKILQKFNPSGCIFYPHGSASDIDNLTSILSSGQRILGIFCEFPSNPLLNSPDLIRLHQLSEKFDVPLIVDETIGTLVNVAILPLVTAVVSSLTKIFSGDCNVLGGSMVLNPQSSFYKSLKSCLSATPSATGEDGAYEDNLFAHDAIFLERNSRTFASRQSRINATTLALCTFLSKHPLIKKMYYPPYTDTKSNYDAVMLPPFSNATPGYGGLFSITFYKPEHARIFYDNLKVSKGPSLGTNFTLASPFTLLAHYQELDWAEECGVDRDLVRVSVGLEDKNELIHIFTEALEKIEH